MPEERFTPLRRINEVLEITDLKRAAASTA